LISIELFLGFLAVGVIAAIIPGPSIFYSVHQSATLGFKRALPSLTGLLSGSAIYGILALLGISAFILQYPNILSIIQTLGIAVLMVMGIKHFIFAGNVYIAVKNHSIATKDYFQGLLIALSNPKILIFYIFVIPQFIDVSLPQQSQVNILVAAQILIKAVVLLAYSFLTILLSKKYIGKLSVKLINKICGLLLMSTAIVIVIFK